MKSAALFSAGALLAPALINAIPLELEKRAATTTTITTTVTVVAVVTLAPGQTPEEYLAEMEVDAATTAPPSPPTYESQEDEETDDSSPAADPVNDDVDPAQEEIAYGEELTDEAPVDEPVVEEPIVEEPVIEQPVVEEPVVEQPVVEQPVVDEPDVEEPEFEEPEVEEPEFGSGDGQIFEGEATYFTPELGACGITSYPSDPICAVSKELYDEYSVSQNPNENPLCHQTITMSYEGNTLQCTILDRCEACVSRSSPLLDE